MLFGYWEAFFRVFLDQSQPDNNQALLTDSRGGSSQPTRSSYSRTSTGPLHTGFSSECVSSEDTSFYVPSLLFPGRWMVSSKCLLNHPLFQVQTSFIGHGWRIYGTAVGRRTAVNGRLLDICTFYTETRERRSNL